jgi:mannan endo-1,4-beta-mannosidase
MRKIYSFRQLFYWLLLPALLFPVIGYGQAADIKVEAESAARTGVEIATSPTGYSGTGYAWGFDTDAVGTSPADHIIFTFQATAGEYDLVIGYYSPYGDKGYDLQVNSQSNSYMFDSTGNAFSTVTVGKYQLVEGQNTVTIRKGWGYYGIDYIAFSPVGTAPVVIPVVNGKVEAENGNLNGVAASTSPTGYSGTGYVTGFDEGTDKVSMTFEATGGLYEVSIRYTSPFGEKGYDLQVNAERGSGMFAGTGSAFASVSAGKYLLKEGLNTVVVGRGWGYFGIDYIQITPSAAPLPVKPPKQLTDAQATSSTRSLFSYLVDMYGSKVLSSQQDDMDYILEKTGKEPAIGGWDLMDYSPSRVENGTNPWGKSEEYIAWAKKGEGNGLITLTWHWNAPTDLINQEPDKLWWSGFYTRATTFDLAAALADKNGERYQLLIRDMDAIAIELKKFQAADIPVLWRPLHEAPGGWFWWGAKGAEPFKELWRIMHDRYTNHHGLHNLIWVYTGTADPAWYPGDNVVDVAGVDIYTDPTANLSADWAGMQGLVGTRKLVALTETGNLPDPDKVRGYATWWSWFMVWTGDGYIKKQPLDFLNAVYNDKDVITRDELPNWRIYGQPTVSITKPTTNAQFYTCETPLLQATAAAANGTVEKVTFLANGQPIGSGKASQGVWQFTWQNVPVGTYSITALAADNEGFTKESAPITVTIKADDVAPVLTVKTGRTSLWPPNHRYVTINLQDFVTGTTDNCGTVSPVTIRQVTSDEAENAPNSGNTRNDIMINPNGQSVQLRAERVGPSNGRVYTITVEATDAAGNTGVATYQVQVPLEKGQIAVADAAAYTVKGKAPAARQATDGNGVNTEVTGEVSVYPNPSRGRHIQVSVYSAVRQTGSFTLVNSLSREMLRVEKSLEAGNNRVQLSVDQLPQGMYLLQVRKDNRIITRKVLINK